MLYSQGVPLEELGVPRADGGPVESDPRTIWRRFADHYPLFRGTPSRMWLDWVFANIFGIEEVLSAANANTHFYTINAALATDAFVPRALFERFNSKGSGTTDGPIGRTRRAAGRETKGASGLN